MTAKRYILAIDQGTTSSRAMLFDAGGKACGVAQRQFPQIFPQPGWVEHDAQVIWRDVLAVCREVIKTAGITAAQVAAIGITNQRETTVLWDRKTGVPLYNAIVWQDRRTAELCADLKAAGHEALVQAHTGLLLDPYFSASKIKWLLDNVSGARERAKRGELAFGTIDSWLLWNLTGGAVHATDATNASRTLLFNFDTGRWDDRLLYLFGIPRQLMPEVRDNDGDFGLCTDEHLGAPVPICGVAGDQQAALVGQACLEEGMLKATYGTGCFVMLNTGAKRVPSANRLLTTLAYRTGGQTSYALEGSIFMAGATMQWLRDGAQMLKHTRDSQAMAEQANPDARVYLVPAFTGLGAPWWDAEARGAILGLTRDTGVAEIVRAGLEAVGYQTRDLLQAMAADMQKAGAIMPTVLRVDGGMAANDWAMQFLADMTGLPVERSSILETTALGAALLAGVRAEFYPSLEAMAANWRSDRRFEPLMGADERASRYAGWRDAVGRVLSAG
ncbi:MAG: glycerol kinase GlpK [Alphaproteobacteria bacterium]|nr:glycerol kinase GlpK [Alphaproteobacteria bacterium]